MSKASKGIFAEAAIVETNESVIAHQFHLTRGLSGTASLVSPLVSVLAAGDDGSLPTALVSPLKANEGTAAPSGLVGSLSSLDPLFSLETPDESGMGFILPDKAAPFGLPDIADEKMLQMMAQDSVNGRLGLLHPDAALLVTDLPIDDEPASVPITIGGTVNGVIDFSGDTDDLTVNLVAGTRYMISVRGTGASALGDSFVEIFNPSMVSVGTDDDGGNGTNSLITINAAVTGTYTIRTSGFGTGTGQYTVDVRQMGTDSVSSNTNASTPFISLGTTFGFRETSSGSALASNAQDVDSYKVHLEAGKYYTFAVAGGADSNTNANNMPVGEIDTVLLLINPAGTAIVAQNDDISFPGDVSSAIGFYATTTGDYYLQVRGYGQGNGAGGVPALAGRNTGGYVIDFKEVPLSQVDPLDSINWNTAANIPTVMVNGVPTATVYFAVAGENFGENARAGDPTQVASGGNGTLVSYGWTQYEKDQFMSAMQEYTKILGIAFVESATPTGATFRVITNSSLAYGAYAYPQDPTYGTQKGIMVFNVDNRGWDLDNPNPAVTTDGLGRGGYAYSTILHEAGHAMGLSHPHDTGGGSTVMLGVVGAQGSLGVFNLNQGVYTQMSYNGGWQTHPDGSLTGSDPTGFRSDAGWLATMGAFDIAQLQKRYGVAPAYATGDNVYTLLDVNAEGTYFETIYDTGGNDTIVYNGVRGAQIDLNTATLDYSVTGGGIVSFVHNLPGETAAQAIKGGFTIANGIVIENATGGSGNDVLIGNAAGNVLTGNGGNDSFMGKGGNDTIVGGLGNDTAHYDGVRSHYTIVAIVDGAGNITGYTVTDTFPASAAPVNDEGTDTLSGVETLMFSDGAFSLAGTVMLYDGGGTLVGTYSTIQAAIDASANGYSIEVSAGTYNESLTINKDVTITGLGEVDIVGNFRAANGVPAGTTVGDWLETNGGYTGTNGATVTVDGVTLENLNFSQFVRAIDLGAASANLTLTDIDIDDSVYGIAKFNNGDADGFGMSGGSITDSYIGIAIDASGGVGGSFDGITITGVTFEHLTEKGLYADHISNASITDIVMTDVGEFGRGPAFGSAAQVGEFGAGIDLNLKYGAYAGILIDGFTFTNVGSSSGPDSVPADYGAAIVVRAREDAPSYAAVPATLDDVVIRNGTIDGTSTGIRLGEPTKVMDSTTNMVVTNVSVTNYLVGAVDKVDTQVLTWTGSAGSDDVTASATTTGPIVVNGLGGDDIVSTGGGNDVLNGGEGDDTLGGGAGEDEIRGEDGSDVLDGGAGVDLIVGGDGDDQIDGGDGADEISGDDGDDVIDGGDGSDLIDGGEGDDIIDGGAGDDEIDGGVGSDSIVAGSGDDSVSGGEGDDTINGGAGDDVIDGGDGTDTAVYAGVRSGFALTSTSDSDGWVTGFSAVEDTNAANGDEGADTLTGVEKLQFGDFAIDLGDPVQLFDAQGQLVGTFGTIQAAIDASNSGGTILIAEGTYVEQLTIEDISGLTIMAREGATVVVKAPSDLAVNGYSESFGVDVRAVIAVNFSTDVTISGIDVDGSFAADSTAGAGSDEFTGIGYFNSSGSIDTIFIDDVGNSQSGGSFGNPQGSGLYIDGGNTAGLEVSVTDSSINDFQKNGAVIFGVAIDFTGNTITGIGATGLLAQNGIQIGNSQGVIDGNSISGLGYTGGISSATGIFAYEPSGSLAITGNSVTGSGAAGSAVGLDLSDVEGVAVEVTGNSFSDLDYGIYAYTFLGGSVGLDTDPFIDGNSFDGISQFGVYFAPEEAILDEFTTTEDFEESGSQFSDYLAGSLGNDSFSGLDGDDILTGNGGDDVLDGGDGNDTAVYGGLRRDYDIGVETDSDGRVTSFTGVVDNGSGNDEGSDALTSVETLEFLDVALDLAAPVQLFDEDGNIIGTFATIQAAIDAASDDQTIRVAAGTYDEDLVIDVGVTILGTGAGEAVGGRDAAGGTGEVTIVGQARVTAADNVTLDGLRFLNDVTTTAPTLQFLTGGGATGHLVTNSIFWSTIAGGANGVDDRAISTVVITDGLITITDNLISGTSLGMFTTASWGRAVWFDGGGVDLVFTGNRVEWSRTGLNLDMSGDSTANVSDNIFRGLGTGIAVGVDANGLTIGDNDVERVGTEFSFRNLTTGVVFDAGAAIGTLTPVGDANDIVVVLGGSGNDTFTGTEGVDFIDGNNNPVNPNAADSDMLYGLGGDDVLFGRGGDDLLDGGTGNDAMTGGAGDDIYVVDSDGDTVIETANEGTDEIRTGLVAYSIAGQPNIENLTGTSNAGQTLTGNDGANVITGADGNDVIGGGDGADTLIGNGGNDVITGGEDDDVIDGGAGDDELYGEGGSDVIDGGAGADLIEGGDGDDLISGGDDDDALAGGDGDDLIDGGEGSDVLDGGDGSDVLTGGEGDDAIDAGAGDDAITGGGGDDDIVGGDGEDTAVYAGPRSDYTVSAITSADGRVIGFTAVQDNVTANGDEGNDALDGVENLVFGDVTLDLDQPVQLFDDGGELVGTFETIQAAIDAASDDYVIRVAAGTYDEDLVIDVGVTILGALAGDAVAGRDAANGLGETNIIGHARVTAADNVTLDGLRLLNDTTTTAPTLQFLTGGGATGHLVTNSIFWSTIAGGANGVDDRAIMINGSAAGLISVTDNLISGASQGQFGTASWGRGIWFDGGGVGLVVTGNTIEWTRTGLNLDMTGNSTANISDNVFRGLGTGIAVGVDAEGLTIADNDIERVGTEFSFRNLTTNVVFDAGAAIGLLTTVGDPNDVVVVLGGSGNDIVTGTEGADYIDGNNNPANPNAADSDVLSGLGGDDILLGRGGDDVLDGGTGNDVMTGGTGNDIFVVDSAGDTVNENANEGTDEIRTGLAAYSIAGQPNIENLTGTSNAGQTLTGNGANNVITGAGGNDVIDGGDGNDTLIGNAGNDVITGGAGNDTADGGANNDVISGGSGNDVLAGGAGVDTLNGGDDDDSLDGGLGNDTLNGDNGNDTLHGGAGNDSLNGGAGTDRAVYDGPRGDYSITTITGAGGRVIGFSAVSDNEFGNGNEGSDALNNVEILQFTNRVLDSTLPVQLFDQNNQLVGTFTTIQSAIDGAQDNYTIRVAAGTYDEDLVIDVGVRILGARTSAVTGRDAAGGVGETTIIGHAKITADDNVTLTGLRFLNDGTTTGGGASNPTLQILNGNNHVVSNSIFWSTVVGGANGVDDRAISTPVIGEGQLTFSGNLISGTSQGLYSTASWGRGFWIDGGGVNVAITGNIVEWTRSGLVLDGAGGTLYDVSGNILRNLGTAFSIATTEDGLAESGNTFRNVGDEYNFRNLSEDVTFDAGASGNTVEPVGTANDVVVILGGSGNDTLTGTAGDDYIDGNNRPGNLTVADSDVLSGGGGNDVLLGRFGFDTLNGGSGEDVLDGGEGNDVINGDGDNDVLIGGAGNDRLAGGGGDDSIDGGSGIDTAIVGPGAAYTANGTSWTVTSASTGTDTLTNVEIIDFGPGPNVLLVGSGGFATIQAAVDAAEDGDTILIAEGTYVEQVVVDGKDNLTITAVDGAQVTIKAPADLVETGRSSSDREVHAVLTAKDSLNLTLQNIDIDGDGRGNSVDEGTGAGQANFYGVFYRNSSGSLLDVDITGVRDPYPGGTATGGQPLVSGVQRGTALVVDNDALLGFTMLGGTISDFQKNGAVFNGADLNIAGVSITGGGAQTIIAQNGIQVSNSTGSISANTIGGIGYAGPADAYSGAILASGNTNLTIAGNAITGANVDDPAAKVVGIWVYQTGAPNSGGSIVGNSISHVDYGIDVTGDITPNGIQIENNGITNLDDSDNDPLGVSFKPNPALVTAHDVDGSDFVDELSGGAGNDILKGLDGDDLLTGEAGDDELYGDGGIDVIDGGAGADTIQGGDGDDVVAAGDGDDMVAGDAGGDVIEGGAGSDILGGGEGDDVIDGGEDDDILSGDEGDDVLDGGEGSDILDGGDGADVLTGGEGDDEINGGDGLDTATYAGPRSDYAITTSVGPDGRVVSFASVQDNVPAGGDDGSDVLTSVEYLAFGDVTLDLDQPVQLFDGNGELVGTYETIQDAVDAASDGYTINVSAGTYDEIVTVDKDVTIVGPNAGVAGDGTRVGEAVVTGFHMNAAGATLDGLTILGGGTIAGNPAGIYVDADNVTLTNLIVQGNGTAGTGILTPYNGGVTGLELSDSRIDDWTNGTYFNPTTQFVASGNSFDGNGVALTGDDWGAGTLISNNSFTNSEFGHVGYGVFDGFEDVGAYFGAGNGFDASGGRIGIYAYGSGQFIIGTEYGDYIADTVEGSGAVFLGGEGDDYLDAGSGDDQLQGDSGNDILIGGSGTDTAYFADDITVDDLTFVADADPETAGDQPGILVNTATEGTDRLVGIEIIDGVNGNILLVGNGGFATIQEAIDAANSGDTIVVAAGTYVEQLTIEDFADLTIMAVPGASVVVKAPAELEINGYSQSFALDVRAVIAVNFSNNVTIRGIDVDGSFAGDTSFGAGDEFTGIGYFNSSGTVDDVEIDDVGNSQDGGSFGLPQGSGLFIDGGTTPDLEMVVTDSTITDFQKNGALIYGVTVTFTGNTITGVGANDLLAQNGLQIGNSQGVIDSNTINGLGYSGGTFSATGIFAYEPTGPLAITANDISGVGAAGSSVGLDLSDVQGISVEVSDNAFSNLDYGIYAYTFLGGSVGLDTDPQIFGNAFDGISQLGIYFAPEESIVDDFSTTTAFFQNGTQFGDYLAGSLGNDGFSGLDGNDVLTGNGGNDQLEGGAGDDLIDGGDGIDTVYFADDITAADLTFVADADPETPGNQGGVIVNTATEGTDALIGIEIIDGINGNILLVGNGGFATIQEAIDRSNPGDTIIVAAGIYVEQLTIEDTANLTLMAVPGATVVVRAPSDLAVNGYSESFNVDARAVIAVNDSININIAGIEIDGNFAADTTTGGAGDEFTGIGYFGSSGSVSQVEVYNVGNSQGDGSFGLPQGSGIYIDGGNTAGLEVSVTDSEISDFQKNGAVIYGVTVNFTGNTITGIGATGLLAQNGIQIGNSQGVVDGNTLSGLGYTGGIASATGIFAYEPSGSLAITNNDITGAGAAGSATGLDLSDVLGVSVEVTGNSFTDLDYGIYAYTFLGGSVGLDTDPFIDGNIFEGISQFGVYFAPEEAILDDFSTTESFDESGSQFDDYLAGSLGDDSFSGLAGDDILTGNGGDDLLDGGDDIDTAVYAGLISDYIVTVETDSDGRVTGISAVVDNGSGYDEGSDSLISIERVEFLDTAIDLADPVQLFDGNGNIIGTFATIQAAIDAAFNGDTIRVAAGTYDEDLVIDVGVTILGTGAGEAVAGRDAAGGVGETTILGHAVITATQSVTLDGLRLLNDTTTTAPTVSITSGGGTGGHTIVNSIFWSTIAGGANGVDDRAISISPIASGLITITDNLISGTSQGQYGTASWGRGIWFDGGGVALVVTGNTIEWTRSAFNLDMSGDSTATISGNVLRGIGTGVSVGVDAVGLTIGGNSVERVNEDFSFRNLTSGITFSAAAAIAALTLVGDFNDPIVVLGGSGNDAIGGTAGVDYLDGNNSPTNPNAADSDSLYGLGGDDFLFGRGGDDFLDGGTGNDQMTGGTGNDVYIVDSAGDTVTELGGEGTDEVRTALATYTLAAALENLTGLGNVNQTLTGNASNNVINGGLGADTMTGGAGNDTYVVDNVGDVVVELAGEGTDEIRTSLAAYSLASLANVENLTGTNAAGQTLTGNASANVITGAAGNDIIDGGAGADTMAGGDGNDLYFVDNAGDVVVELPGGGVDEIRTGLAAYSIVNTAVENLTATNNIAHDFRGNSGANVITTGTGNDIVRAFDGGDDTILTGAGNDNIFMGASLNSADVINAGAGTDTLVIQGNYGGGLVLSASVTEIENISILGGNNTSFGEPGTNRYDYVLTTNDANFAAGIQARINGAALLEGEDFTFNGSAETNASFVVYGGKGVDTLTGGFGNDIFIYAEERFAAGDTVNGGPGGYDGIFFRGNYTIDFNAPGYFGLMNSIENMTLTSITDERYARGGDPAGFDYNITLADNMLLAGVELTVSGVLLQSYETMIVDGSQELDGTFRLFGGRSDDTLKGGAKNDLLLGNLGADQLTGGGGADIFRYDSAADSTSTSRDHILDFTPGTDKVDLSRIDANTLVAGDQAFTVIGTGAFTGQAGQLRAFQQGGDWILQGDTNGDGVADLEIQLTLQGSTPLSQNDFFF